jgi:pyruvate/2-oxoglutarate dehydrogenase complex dihydrolipoamide dehydrogenase (E3) component
MLPGAELGLSFADVLELKTLPARMVVIGGAATGCQLASIFADFGTHVTLIERASRLIPQEDVDLGDALGRAFAARGMDVRVDTPAERLRRIDGGVEVLLGSGQRVTGDAVFLAVGWPANLRHLALDAAGIATIGNYIHVDAQLRTSQPHIFAVGDANGIRKLMQTAAHQGRIAAENAVVDAGRAYHSGIVPSGSFTDPEYAGVGMTEEEARATGDCVVARHEYRLLTRAVVDGRVDGFCKLIADRGTGIVIGAHVMGEAAAEVVQLVAACMTTGMNVLQMAELQLAYPTYTQAVGLAALRLAQVLDLLPAGEGFDSAELSVDR